MSNFKITHYAINEPQHLELCFDKSIKSDKFEDSYSTQVIHEGEKKYWNFSGFVNLKLIDLNVKKGDVVAVTRKEGEKGKSYTEVTVKGDITTQPQNVDTVKPLKQERIDKNNQEREHNEMKRQISITGQCFAGRNTLGLSTEDREHYIKTYLAFSELWYKTLNEKFDK